METVEKIVVESPLLDNENKSRSYKHTLGRSGQRKRELTIATVEKWKLVHDKTMETGTWLKYEEAEDKFHVAKLKCSVCVQFEQELKKISRNFSSAFIEGTSNLRTSSFLDHAKCETHKRAMEMLKQEQSLMHGHETGNALLQYTDSTESEVPFGEGKQIRKPACKRDYPSCTPLSGKRAKKPRRDLKHVADPVGSEERMSSSIFTGSFISAIAASSIAKEELSILPEAIQIRTEQWVDTLQPVLLNSGTSNTNGSEPKENSIQSVSRTSRRDGVCMKFGSGGLVSGVPTTCVSIPGALEPSEHNIKKRETAVEVESRCSLQESSSVDGESNSGGVEGVQDSVSIYKMLFNISSSSNGVFPSVVEALHLGMKETADVAGCLQKSELILHQILSLPPDYCVMIAPCPTSAYCISVFAAMMAQDPLSTQDQISSSILPFAVLHDAYCEHFQQGSNKTGHFKTATSLTGCHNWNLGDTSNPMDADGLRMAVHSNRVAALLHQPYAYPRGFRHLSLTDVVAICQCPSFSCSVSVIVDATEGLPPEAESSRGSMLETELKFFIEHGANLVLMPPLHRVGGVSRCTVVIGTSALLDGVRQQLSKLQRRVCLPLICEPHELIATVVTYKALQELIP